MTSLPVPPEYGAAPAAVVKCSRCGGPMPELPPELASLAASVGSAVLAHDVCPGGTADPGGRYFEVRTQIVEVTETPGFGDGAPAKVETEEFISFRTGLRATNLAAAMRPLAEALGEKWMVAEKQANVADQ